MTACRTKWRRLSEGRYEADLPGGTFWFEMTREDVPLPDLCDVAVRNNSRRRFLFVSRVLGRHMPTLPADVRATAQLLAVKLWHRLQVGPTLFVGMSETATTLGQAVFGEFLTLGGNGLYIESTRRTTGRTHAFEFSEIHSHATNHVIHLPSPIEDPECVFATASQIIIIDDEATTARTASELVRAVRKWRGANGAPLEAWLATILKWDNDGESATAFAGVVSLASGTFKFVCKYDTLNNWSGNDLVNNKVVASCGIRHGCQRPQELPVRWKMEARENEKILVIGNGEYGYQPLLVAEALEEFGATVRLMATTRSPILPGGAISHIRSFPALSGEGYTEFLYNVPPAHGYDRVILCLEDAAPASGHPVFEIPNLEVWT